MRKIKIKRVERLKARKIFFMAPLCLAILSMFAVSNNVNAAPRSPASRTAPTARKSVAATTATVQANIVEEVAEEEPEAPVIKEEEPVIINKASQFDDAISTVIESSVSNNSFAEQINKQRAAIAASEASSAAESAQKQALKSGSNKCDADLRKCMIAKCDKDFTKCALDGDTIFGDKLNACKRDTTCTSEEFNLFIKEIKADRDMNVRLASYNNVVNCGNQYNACIMNECGTTYNKCLGKPNADAAIQKCASIAKDCTEADSGLVSRFGTAIGKLRENAEIEAKKDEERLYALRDLMRSACEKLGAAFDERTFDCVYTVNFFAGEEQDHPMASRKRYAGDTFVCMQEWFGINVTTYRENADRLTKSQTAASSAMLGSGVGTAAGLITSGAIGRALETQKAKKALDEEKKEQGLDDKSLKDKECTDRGGEYKASACYCGSVMMLKNDKCGEDGKIQRGANKESKDKGTNGNYTYFKPLNDGTDCEIKTYADLAMTKQKERIMPDQCYLMVQNAHCPTYVESYHTNGKGKCLELGDQENKSNSGVISKQECERCIVFWQNRTKCAEEAEDWCKKNNK